MIGVFMVVLDNGIIFVVLIMINELFVVFFFWGLWGIIFYMFGFSVSVLIVGKFFDCYGRKKFFFIEVCLFGFGFLFVVLS